MRRHILLTNDYPPKVGGIQNYLFELWSRLPPDDVVVVTRNHPDAAAFDRTVEHRVVRIDASVLLPNRRVAQIVQRLARETGAELVVIDPVLPLGLIGPRLGLPYALVLHGAELTVPAHLPVVRDLVRRAIVRAELLVVSGAYPEGEARRLAQRSSPPIAAITPGVDPVRFHPLDPEARRAARARFGLGEDALVVGSVSRLVPRKGMDVLIEATAQLAARYPDLEVVIGGRGRDAGRLERLIARTRAPVRLLGRVSEEDLPILAGAADVWAMLCRTRWLGLEQEGFGIVFLEGAAAGTPQLAGLSGGSAEAVLHEQTGLVVDRPGDVTRVIAELDRLLGDRDLRERYGAAARARVLEAFTYERLAAELIAALEAHGE